MGRDGALLPFATEAEVLEFLSEAEIVGGRELSSGTTRPWRYELERNGVRARAVFRIVDRRRERLRMRDGRSYAVFYDRATSEVAAYRLDRLLGLGMVPPTVLRTIDGREGSLQLWVEGAMTEQQRVDRGLTAADPLDWMRQRAVMQAFDALIGNADRNTGNSLIDAKWNLWMIDHTRAFQRPRGGHDLSRVNHLPASVLERLGALDTAEVEDALGSLLEPPQVTDVLERRDLLLQHIDQLVAERGEGAVILHGQS